MKTKLKPFLIMLAGLLFSISCSKNEGTSPLPVITNPSASDVSNITDSTASINVTITSEGASAITAKGVCWSTAHNPTIADDKTSNRHGAGYIPTNKITDISDNLTFTAVLTGLSAGTNYYVRVYATNSSGTAYSEEITITTTGTFSGTVTDVDGNVYQAVQIGTQVWMKENLKTTRYKDGTTIPTGLSNAEWLATTTGAYTIYNNNAANNTTYGKLYNWHAVNTGKLAPAGWHVPTDAEWTTLITFLGGESVAGNKMKAITLWGPHPGITNTNSSGFTALPAGKRSDIGPYGGIGYYGYFWSSTEDNNGNAWYRFLEYNTSYAYRGGSYKESGSSVRCVRD